MGARGGFDGYFYPPAHPPFLGLSPVEHSEFVHALRPGAMQKGPDELPGSAAAVLTPGVCGALSAPASNHWALLSAEFRGLLIEISTVDLRGRCEHIQL